MITAKEARNISNGNTDVFNLRKQELIDRFLDIVDKNIRLQCKEYTHTMVQYPNSIPYGNTVEEVKEILLNKGFDVRVDGEYFHISW